MFHAKINLINEFKQAEEGRISKRNINFTRLIPGCYRLSVSIRQCLQLTAADCTPWSIRLRTFRRMRSNKLPQDGATTNGKEGNGSEPSEAIFLGYSFCVNKHNAVAREKLYEINHHVFPHPAYALFLPLSFFLCSSLALDKRRGLVEREVIEAIGNSSRSSASRW